MEEHSIFNKPDFTNKTNNNETFYEKSGCGFLACYYVKL